MAAKRDLLAFAQARCGAIPIALFFHGSLCEYRRWPITGMERIVEDLLPYYERELGFLRTYSREFAARYPKIAGRLLMAGGVCEDPHIERMIEAFALLNARVAKRLDDDYPKFTEALFDVLYPHYLRPFPSCSIARCNDAGAAGQGSGATLLPRHSAMTSRQVRGGVCTFRTAYPVSVAPLEVTAARFDAIISHPDAVRMPAGVSALLSITVASLADQGGVAQQGVQQLRVFIDGEPSFCAALRDTLFMRTVAAWVEVPGSGQWRALPAVPLAPAGFNDDESLIDFPARSHAAYRLLTEYFCFPEKFNFFDIDLAMLGAAMPPGARTVTLHLALAGLRADSATARALAPLAAHHLLLGCTPIVNLFATRGDPIQVTHAKASYPVLPDGRRPYGFDVYAIDAVRLVRQGPQGETVTEFRPFYSLRHGQAPDQSGHYWMMRRDEHIAAINPGHETEITIVDIDFDPAEVAVHTLSLELTGTNRDLPTLLLYNQPGGDMLLAGSNDMRSVRMLRKPTPPHRFARVGGVHWRLISHLSLNHLSLSDGGVDSLREMLALYDLPRSPSTQRQIGGIHAIAYETATTWLPGNPFACLVRGLRVRMTIDEDAFVGAGIHAFAQVIERFLGLYVHANSFTQLVIVSEKTGEPLLTCPPRSGDLSLL
jgi:type VI secretion system protein ImpG